MDRWMDGWMDGTIRRLDEWAVDWSDYHRMPLYLCLIEI